MWFGVRFFVVVVVSFAFSGSINRRGQVRSPLKYALDFIEQTLVNFVEVRPDRYSAVPVTECVKPA